MGKKGQIAIPIEEYVECLEEQAKENGKTGKTGVVELVLVKASDNSEIIVWLGNTDIDNPVFVGNKSDAWVFDYEDLPKICMELALKHRKVWYQDCLYKVKVEVDSNDTFTIWIDAKEAEKRY